MWNDNQLSNGSRSQLSCLPESRFPTPESYVCFVLTRLPDSKISWNPKNS
jgi:hypothetical protein